MDHGRGRVVEGGVGQLRALLVEPSCWFDQPALSLSTVRVETENLRGQQLLQLHLAQGRYPAALCHTGAVGVTVLGLRRRTVAGGVGLLTNNSCNCLSPTVGTPLPSASQSVSQ